MSTETQRHKDTEKEDKWHFLCVFVSLCLRAEFDERFGRMKGMCMLRNCYALLLAMLMVRTIAAKPQILLDKDFSKTDQKTDFAGRGRLAIPLETASTKPEVYRLDIESRDATRSPVFLSAR